MRILLIEDEMAIADLLAARLKQHGYVVDGVGTLAEAEAAMACATFALVILDRRLPDGDGLTLIPALRRLQQGTPVIVLSALDDVLERIAGLDSGADDYLGKPVDLDELMARVRAALRRPGATGSPPVACGNLSFLPESRTVLIDGQVLLLPRRELALLEALIMRARRVVQREVLINEIFNFEDDVQSNTLDSHVSRLRGRLAAANAGVSIHPVRGVGYLLDLSIEAS